MRPLSIGFPASFGDINAKIDMAFFPSVEGSTTREDGHTFMPHVKRPTGGELLPGFPHSEIPNTVENAAVQAAQGQDANDQKTVARLSKRYRSRSAADLPANRS
jgi:hypothetical protein